MSRSDLWILTIHFDPRGLRNNTDLPPELRRPEPRPNIFHFEHPPSREDFLEVCQRFLPWTVVWKDSLLAMFREERCDWPMLDYGHKGAVVDLLDEEDREIGKIEVWRHTLFVNEPYSTLMVTVAARDRALRGYRGQDRDALRDYLNSQENRIRENLARLHKRECRPLTEADLDAELHQAVLRWRAARKKSRLLSRQNA